MAVSSVAYYVDEDILFELEPVSCRNSDAHIQDAWLIGIDVKNRSSDCLRNLCTVQT